MVKTEYEMPIWWIADPPPWPVWQVLGQDGQNQVAQLMVTYKLQELERQTEFYKKILPLLTKSRD